MKLKTIVCPYHFNSAAELIFNHKYEALDMGCDFWFGFKKNNPSEYTKVIKYSYKIFMTMYIFNR